MKQLNLLRLPPLSRSLLIALAAALSLPAAAQKTRVVDSGQPGYRTVVAGQEYKKNGIYRLLWGKHYRKEWTTPVQVPVIDLASFRGGLVPVKEGGRRQAGTLRLKDKSGREYTLSTIDKDYSHVLPVMVRKGFIEALAKDLVSAAHPFSALTIPGMGEAAGLYPTRPQIVLIASTPALGTFNGSFANMLCLLEERPAGDGTDAARAVQAVGTEKMYADIFSNHDHRVDQKAFVRARLFDMFLGDWGRRDEQWRWARLDSNGHIFYRPIPRDRDQAYARFDGLLM